MGAGEEQGPAGAVMCVEALSTAGGGGPDQVRARILEHAGHVVHDEPGRVVARFSRAEDAVACAMGIRASCPADEGPRIGVCPADTLEAADEAARVAAVAPRGAVVLSESLAAVVEGRVSARLAPLEIGPSAGRVRVATRLPARTFGPLSRDMVGPGGWRPALAIMVGLGAAIAGAVFAWPESGMETPVSDEGRLVHGLPPRMAPGSVEAPRRREAMEARLAEAVAAHEEAVHQCWTELLADGPAPARVDLTLTLHVGAEGDVSGAAAAGEPPPALGRCLEHAAAAWRLPPSEAPYVFTWPLVFASAPDPEPADASP